jgi:translocation and assembly module TamB
MMRALRYGLLAIAGLVVLAGLAILMLATPPGRSVLASIVARAASGNGLSVSIGSLSGWPPFAFGADGIVLSDSKGPFAEIDGLTADVDVGALLSGGIRLRSIGAKRVAIAREPSLPSSGSSGGSLFPLAAEKLEIARLELGAGLIGNPAALSLSGSFVAGASGSLEAHVDAKRVDRGEGSLTASVARAGGSAPIAVDLTAEEAANGILLGLMGRDAGPGYRLVARTSLDGEALNGSVSLTSEGDARFSGRIGLTPAADGRHLTVEGQGDLAELVPPGFADILAGRIDIAVDATWTDVAGTALPQIVFNDSKVTTGTVQMTASGVFGGANTDLSVKVEAAHPDGGPISLPVVDGDAVRFDSLSLTGRVAPADNAQRLDLTGRVGGLAVGTVKVPGIGLSLAIEAEGKDPLADDKLPFALRLEADAIDLADGRIAATDAAPLLLTADGTLDVSAVSAATNLDLSAVGGRALFSGNVSPEKVTGETKARFGDLAPLSPLLGRQLAGALSATLKGQFFGANGVKLAIDGTASDLDPGEPSLAPLLAGQTRFTLNLTDDLAGRLALEGVSVAGATLTVDGGMSLDGRSIDGSFNGTVADLAALADQSSGAATFSAKVAGSLDRPTFDATVQVADGRLVDQPIRNATVSVKGEPVDAGWRGALKLGGSFAGRPLEGTAQAVLDAATGRLAFPDVDLAIAENRITGSIEQADGGLLSGSLSVEAPNLATLAAFALVEATGTAKGSIRFQPDGGKQSIAVAFSGGKIATSGLVADQADGEVHIDDAFGMPRIAGNVDAGGIAVGSVRLDRAHLSATVEGEATKCEANAHGPEIDLTGAGSLESAGGGQFLRIASLTGKAYGFPVKTDAPATLRLGAETRIDSASLALGGGHLSVKGLVSPRLDLDVSIDKVAASFADQFSPGLGAEGTISGSAKVTGTAAAPAIAWQANWSGFSVAETTSAGLPRLSVTAKGDATAKVTTLAATLSGAGISLDVSGRIPFAGGNPDIRAKGTAPLQLLGLATDRELVLGGTAQVDLTIAGASSISGTVSLADATIVDTVTKLGVSGVAAQIRLDGRNATIERLTGRAAQGGDITVTGTVAIDPAGGLPANLSINVRNGRYTDGTTVDATYTASLSLSGPILTTGKIAGRIDVARAEILLPDRFGGGTTLNVEHVNTAPGFVPPVKPAPPPAASGVQSGGGLGLDITASSTNSSSIIVRGFGLDAELGGSLRVTGTTGNPVTVGGFDLLRGRIEVLGRRFDFTSGRLTFAGDLIPILDFKATTRTSEITATVLVAGPADDPQISFTSSPALPEEEIISQLLFDRTVGRLTAFQAAQLVDAIGQFSGAFGRGDGLFTRVRKLTGLDDLDVRQNDTGGTTVGIGKRINDNIRLGVEQDTKGTGRVTIDLDITRNLKARGEAGGDGSGKVGLTYEREY